ncbi:MAG: SH3 domain-containing protein [Dehalococcoidia bacterium]|nr:SH3 domain-containing protein [Dehalococcoidia bacterium]
MVECWTFVRQVVEAATGNLMGFGYHDGFIEGGAVEVSLETARRGDIIQLADPTNNGPGVSYVGLHTAIVLERYDDGTFAELLTRNYGWGEMVSVHDYDPMWSANRYSHIQPRVYRFTSMESEAPPASEPAPTQEPDDLDFGAGDRVRVSAGGDCLNLRAGAGTNHGVRTCMAHGAELTVIDGPVAAGSYTWVQVRMDDGTEGWVAATFLEVVDAASAGRIGRRGPRARHATATPEPTSTPEPTPESG